MAASPAFTLTGNEQVSVYPISPTGQLSAYPIPIPTAAMTGLFGPNIQKANYTFTLADLGAVVLIPPTAGSGITLTIPLTSPTTLWPKSYVPVIRIVNQSANSVSVTAAGTLNRRDGTFMTGPRTIAANSSAMLEYYGSIALDNWDISGNSLS
jgi:hypothetical protein